MIQEYWEGTLLPLGEDLEKGYEAKLFTTFLQLVEYMSLAHSTRT